MAKKQIYSNRQARDLREKNLRTNYIGGGKNVIGNIPRTTDRSFSVDGVKTNDPKIYDELKAVSGFEGTGGNALNPVEQMQVEQLKANLPETKVKQAKKAAINKLAGVTQEAVMPGEEMKKPGILDYISAPLSQPGTTLTKGLTAGATAVQEQRAVIENAPTQQEALREAAGVIGTTAASTAVAAAATFAGAALAASQTATTTAVANTAATKATATAVTSKLFTASTIAGAGAYFARQKAQDSNSEYQASLRNIKSIIRDTNAGLLEPDEAVELFQIEVNNINRAERNLKLLTKIKPIDWASGAGNMLENVYGFKRVLPLYQRRLQAAIIEPNPNAVQQDGDGLSTNN